MSRNNEARLEVLAEIHVPGLDLEPQRWNHHLILFEEIHDAVDDVAVCAWTGYQSKGRGSVCVGLSDWRQIVAKNWLEDAPGFPCTYLTVEELGSEFDFGILSTSFQAIVDQYDPKHELVVAVRHHPGSLLSAYLLTTAPGPGEVAARVVDGNQRSVAE